MNHRPVSIPVFTFMAFALIAFPAFSQTSTIASTSPQATETAFKVEKIDSPQLLALKAADAELSKATASLVAAQGIAADAKGKYDAAKADIVRKYGVFEGDCSLVNRYGISRSYRRIDIRGAYVLISEGYEKCPMWVTLTGNGGTVISEGSSAVASTQGK